MLSPDESKQWKLDRTRWRNVPDRPDHYRVENLERARRSWTSWLAGALAVDGWLMPRHAMMPEHDDSTSVPVPRPSFAQMSRCSAMLKRHSHRRIAGWRGERPIYRLRPERRGLEAAAPRSRHEAKVCDLDKDGSIRAHYPQLDPDQEVLPTGHLHPLTGDVVVPFRRSAHAHWDMAKYVYTPGNTARRLGTNPLNIRRRFEGDLFVVVLEGTLKMCAVAEAGYPCIDAGSVTLWGSQSADPVAEWDEELGSSREAGSNELEEFAEMHLRGRDVAVVCDSDWYANKLVRDQTEKVAAILRPLVSRAVACAPPEGKSYGWHHPITGIEMREKRGIDDWLGKQERGDRYDAFQEIGFFDKIREAELRADDARLASARADGAQTTVDVLRVMAELAPPGSPVAPYAQTQIAERLGRSKSRVQEAYERAIRLGLAKEVIAARKRPSRDDGFFMEPPLARILADEAMPTYEWRTLREWLRG